MNLHPTYFSIALIVGVWDGFVSRTDYVTWKVLGFNSFALGDVRIGHIIKGIEKFVKKITVQGVRAGSVDLAYMGRAKSKIYGRTTRIGISCGCQLYQGFQHHIPSIGLKNPTNLG